MTSITKEVLYKILYIATAQTYLQELIKATHGKGIVASECDLEVNDNGIFLFNEQFGDIVRYLEEGTDPHIIRPKTSKALAFKWSSAPGGISPNGKGGEFVFKKVKHPGIEARHFVQEVITNPIIEELWQRVFEEELEKEINKYI